VQSKVILDAAFAVVSLILSCIFLLALSLALYFKLRGLVLNL